MGILETNDAGLRHLVPAQAKAVVVFTADHCAACEQLRPLLDALATHRSYASVAFLRLNTDHNPEARQLMRPHAAPFFVSYCHGRVVHCASAATEQQVRTLLGALAAHL